MPRRISGRLLNGTIGSLRGFIRRMCAPKGQPWARESSKNRSRLVWKSAGSRPTEPEGRSARLHNLAVPPSTCQFSPHIFPPFFKTLSTSKLYGPSFDRRVEAPHVLLELSERGKAAVAEKLCELRSGIQRPQPGVGLRPRID